MAASSGGITPQTLAFLTSANAPVAFGTVSNKPMGSGTGTGGSGGTTGGASGFLSTLGSIGSRALDILSRPLYAVASGADEALKEAYGAGTKGESILGQIGQGLMGRSKEDFTNMVQDWADLNKQQELTGSGKGYHTGEASVNPWAKLGLGLAGDIFLDPSTYVGPGLIKDIIKAPIMAAKGVHAATDVAEGAIHAESPVSNVAHTLDEATNAEHTATAARAMEQGTLPFPPREPTPQEVTKELVGGKVVKAAKAGKLPAGPPISEAMLPGMPGSREEIINTFRGPGGPLNFAERNLPEWMDKYKPQVGFGYGKNKPLEFADGVSKALYIVREGKKLSIRDREYLNWVKDKFPGETEAEIRARGTAVSNSVKEMAKTALPGETIVVGDHPEAYSRDSQNIINTYKAQAAARDTVDAINALDTPAEKMEAGIAAKNAAKGNPFLEPVINEAVDNATKLLVPPAVAAVGSKLANDVANGTSATGMRALADTFGEHDAIIGLKSKLLNPKNPGFNTSGKLRVSDRTFLKYLNSTAGLRNIGKAVAAKHNLVQGSMQEYSRIMLNGLVKKYSQETLNAAWLAMKNGTVSNATPDVVAAAKEIAGHINRLLGPTDVTGKALEGTTILHRYGLGQKELNFYLPKAMQFSNKVHDLPERALLDFSKPGDWRNSWQVWDTENPLEALYHINSALTKATSEKLWYASLPGLPGIRWAEKTLPAGMVRVEHPLGFTEGMAFEPWMASEIKNEMKAINEFRGMNSKGWQFFDRAQNSWKSVVTLPNPVHHVHNAIGDSFLSFMHGMTNPFYYTKSARVMLAMKKFFPGIDQGVLPVEKLFGGGEHTLTTTLGKTAKPSDVIAKIPLGRGKKAGLTIEQVTTALHNLGVLPNYSTVEDLALQGGRSRTLTRGIFKGSVMSRLGRVSESREHIERVAYFLYRLENPRAGRAYNNIREAIDMAAADTKFVHPTGQDMTQFERSVMRRVMPFYSWTRRSTPAVLTALAENPGRAIAYYKFTHALGVSQGVNQPSISNQFPTDQAFPNWIRQGLVGPQFGKAGSYMISDMQDPVSGVFQMLVDPIHFAGSMLSPGIQVPVSMVTGSDVARGSKIYSPGTYINQNTPVTSLFDRLANVNIGPGSLIPETRKGALQLPAVQTPAQTKQVHDWRGLVSWLTGAGLFDPNAYLKKKP